VKFIIIHMRMVEIWNGREANVSRDDAFYAFALEVD